MLKTYSGFCFFSLIFFICQDKYQQLHVQIEQAAVWPQHFHFSYMNNGCRLIGRKNVTTVI